MLQFRCACGKLVGVPDEAAGRRVKCPKCGRVARVGDPGPAAMPPEAGGEDLSFPGWAWGLIAFAVVAVIGGAYWAFRPDGTPTPAAAMADSTPDAERAVSGSGKTKRAAEAKAEATASAARSAAETAAASAPAEPPRYQPESRPARAPAMATISGGAWLSRNDGGSDLQRGLKVFLLPDTLPQATAAQLLQDAADKFDEWAAEERETANEYRASQRELGLGGIYGDFIKEAEDRAQEYEGRAAECRSRAAGITEPVETATAYDMACDAARFVPYFVPAQSAAVGVGRAGIDGKYSISSVLEGRYFLYARVDTPTLFVEWLVPVTVGGEGEPVEVDLFNDNAATLRNGL